MSPLTVTVLNIFRFVLLVVVVSCAERVIGRAIHARQMIKIDSISLFCILFSIIIALSSRALGRIGGEIIVLGVAGLLTLFWLSLVFPCYLF